MKKTVSIILSLMLVISIFTPSFAKAEQDEELKEIIVKVKELLNIREEYDKFEYDIREYGGEKQYNLRWSDSQGELGEIYVNVDSDGIITSYSHYIYNEEVPITFQNKISREEAKEIADKFIEKIIPDYLDHLYYEKDNYPESIYSNDYDITYVRRENGVDFPNNYVSISIDKYSKNVRRYYLNWDKDVTFLGTNNILSLDEAKEIYSSELGLDLVYKYKWEKDKVEPYLVYSNIKPGVINAKTGKIINEYYPIYFREQEVKIEDGDTNAYSYEEILTEAEIEAIENIKEMLSKEKAEEMAREKLNIGQDLKINYSRLYKDRLNNEDFIWDINFKNEDEENYQSATVRLDAKTGEIKYFYKSTSFEKDDVAKYDEQQSLKIAEDFIKEYQPDKFDMVERLVLRKPVIYLNDTEQKLPLTQSFNFVRKVNGAYVLEDGFDITVNAVTGEVTRYQCKWYKGEFPSADDIISRDKAHEIIFEKAGMNLMYIYDYEKKEGSYETSTDNQRQTKLIYTMGKYVPLNVDPRTGNILKNNGEIFIDERIVEYTDIECSIAEKEIQELAKYGISLPTKEFKPREYITQREFLYLLTKATYPYRDIPFLEDGSYDDDLYEYIIDRGIIKEEEKNPDSTVKKEDALVFIVRALGYDELASIKDIYIVPVKDADKISPEKLGSVAISYGLGIVSADNGLLNPLDKIKKEEAALMIYNFLNVLVR